jgi:hypothetical protein
VHFDDGAVEADRFDFDAHELLMLHPSNSFSQAVLLWRALTK